MAASVSEARAGAATRNTIQRALVLEAVQSLHDHPTSADVYEVVRKKHPNISRATVCCAWRFPTGRTATTT